MPTPGNKKGQSASAAASAAASATSLENALASLENVAELLSRNIGAYNHVNLSEINMSALNDQSRAFEESSQSSSSAAASATTNEKAFAKVAATLDETSRVIARVKAEAAAAADAALVAAVKAKLARDTGLGALIIGHLSEVPPIPMLQCAEIKAFLVFLWLDSRINLMAREQLHPYIFDGKKSPNCKTATEKDIAMYLVDIIGGAPKAGEPVRGILFRTDIFNKGTIPGLPFSSPEALNYFFIGRWVDFLKTPAAYKKKKGGSRKRRRRLNRTKKI